jgi:ABC-type microcin C transport system permease subunit YejE
VTRRRALVLALLLLGALSWWLPAGPVGSVVRVTLGLGLPAGLLGATMAWALAAMAYTAGDPLERLVVRGFEAALSLPFLVLAALVAHAWRGEWRLLWALALVRAAQGGHRLLSESRAVEAEPFFEAACAMGARRWWLFRRHLAPALAPATLPFILESAALAAPLDALVSFAGAGSGLLDGPVRAAVAQGDRGPLLAVCLTAAVLGVTLTAVAEMRA